MPVLLTKMCYYYHSQLFMLAVNMHLYWNKSFKARHISLTIYSTFKHCSLVSSQIKPWHGLTNHIILIIYSTFKQHSLASNQTKPHQVSLSNQTKPWQDLTNHITPFFAWHCFLRWDSRRQKSGQWLQPIQRSQPMWQFGSLLPAASAKI